MYTTAEAVSLLVRAALSSAGVTVWPEQLPTVATLVELGIATHHVKQTRDPHNREATLTMQWIELTPIGLVIWREIQVGFEELCSKARKASDERHRRINQRSLPLQGRDDR